MEREWRDITTLDLDPSDALLILSPQLEFTNDEVNYLRDLLNTKVPVIFIGNSKAMFNLIGDLHPVLPVIREYNSNNRIFDYTNNLNDDPAYPLIRSSPSTPDLGTLSSLTPTPILQLGSSRFSPTITFSTFDTSEISSCITTIGEGCQQSFSVGAIFAENNVAIYSDNWVLSNSVVAKSASNLDLISTMLDQMSVEVDRIMVDESHYEWAPVNQNGVIHFVENSVDLSLFLVIALLLFITLPLFIAYSGGALGKEKDERIIAKNLDHRLERIHVEKQPAVPLTLEEKILVEEYLEYRARGKYYYQYVATQLLGYIESNDLEDAVDKVLPKLREMQSTVLTTSSVWSILQDVTYRLDLDDFEVRTREREQRDEQTKIED